MNSPRHIRRLIVFAVFALIAGSALAWLLFLVRSTLLLVYVSALFAVGLAPLVRLIERQRILRIGQRRLPRAAAILLIYAALVGALVLLGMAIIPSLVQQADELWRNLPERLDAAQRWLVTRGILQRPVTLGEAMRRAPTAESTDAVTTLLGAVWSVVGGVLGIVTLLLLTFYLLVESRGIFETFVRSFPREQRARVAGVSQIVAGKVSAWLGGQLLLSLIIGVSSGLFLWAIGVPYPFVLALISAVGELIPLVGPIIAAIPAILVALSVSGAAAGGTAIFFLVQQQIENAVLVPKIMGTQVGVSATTVIIALGVGSELLGVVGAILSVPTAAILQVLFEEVYSKQEPGDGQSMSEG